MHPDVKNRVTPTQPRPRHSSEEINTGIRTSCFAAGWSREDGGLGGGGAYEGGDCFESNGRFQLLEHMMFKARGHAALHVCETCSAAS